MTIRFILGRAGSGKTTACLQAMAELSKSEPLGAPLIFLVPEQATFQMERELTRLCGGGTFRAQVLSFQRLARRMLQGRRNSPTLISEQGKQMILRRLLRERAVEMVVLSKAAKQPRFCQQLSAQLRELNNYKITPGILRERAESAGYSTVLQGKLLDLAKLASVYQSYIRGRFVDSENMLQMLVATLEDGALPADTRVWVDGFAGFTLQEYAVLGAFSKAALQIELALCLDPSHLKAVAAEEELFHPTLDSLRRLQQLAAEKGVKVLPPLILPSGGSLTRYAQCSPLAHLEAQFNRIPSVPYLESTAKIKLVTTAGTRAEVEAVARDICRIVREYGWHYADIGVILRDFSAYHDLVAAVFREYQIPCYLDTRHSTAHHPLVEFLRSASEAALTNLSATSVIQLLKTDLFPLERLEVDRLENYVRAHGIRGRHWLDGKPWTFRLRLVLDDERQEESIDLTGLNSSKKQFAHYFEPFFKAVAGSGIQEVTVYCRALWSLLDSVSAQSRLESWAEVQTAEGEMNQAAQHRQVWHSVVELIDQLTVIWAGQTMNLQEFIQLFFTGLENLTSGLTPVGIDQVVVGSVEGSRLPQIRAAYVLGLSEGDFPARLREEGLFGDEERDLLAESGVELAATRRQKLFHEQYLSYIALTRSSDYLWVSYPLADEEGKEKRPSLLFKRLREIFPLQEIQFIPNLPGSDENGAHFAESQKIAATLLLQANHSKQSGQMSPFWITVYNEALQRPLIASAMKKLWPALSETNIIPALSPTILKELYSTPFKSSVSRLELFARCPLAHFARYALRLEERLEYRLEAPEMGIFYHAALKQFVEEFRLSPEDWLALNDDEAKERMNLVVENLAPRLRNEILMSTERMRHLAEKLKDTLGQMAGAMTEYARSGTFLPVALELTFGKSLLPPWRLTALGIELWLYGQIDRVDLAESADRAYLCVLDYKTNPQELKLSDVWHGLALQLLSYQAVVLEQAACFTKLPAESGGVFYLAIQQSMERAKNPPPAGQIKKTRIQLDGLALADPEVLEMLGGTNFVRRASLKNDGTFTKTSRVVDRQQLGNLLIWLRGKLVELTGQILAGDVAAQPYFKANGQRACSFCPFLALCRFDVSVAGNSYRILENMKDGEVLMAIANGNRKE